MSWEYTIPIGFQDQEQVGWGTWLRQPPVLQQSFFRKVHFILICTLTPGLARVFTPGSSPCVHANSLCTGLFSSVLHTLNCTQCHVLPDWHWMQEREMHFCLLTDLHPCSSFHPQVLGRSLFYAYLCCGHLKMLQYLQFFTFCHWSHPLKAVFLKDCRKKIPRG